MRTTAASKSVRGEPLCLAARSTPSHTAIRCASVAGSKRPASRAASAVLQVARLANGSMRDALSLLDRLVAASTDGRITQALLAEVLGMPDTAVVSALAAAVGAGDPRAALERAAALLEGGTSVEQALVLLADRFRTLM
ncbi:MAG: hypothetical protein ACKOTD_08665, partial [Phycisphaerales bacterium]